MKLRVALGYLAGLVVATSLLAEGDAANRKKVRINLDEPAPAAPQPPAKASNKATAAPAKTGPAPGSGGAKSEPKPSPAKKADPKKEEPEHKVDGFSVSRGERGYLGIKVAGGFRVSFYDAEKKPIAPDVDRIAVRWPVTYQPNDERTLLLPSGDGKVMSSDKVVRPPHRFKLYLTLLKGEPGTEASPETYIVDFSQG